MKGFLLILVTTSLFACNEGISEAEKFNIFIEKFLTNKEFELSRTSFPLSIYKHVFDVNPDRSDDNETIETIVLRTTIEEQPPLHIYMKKNGLKYIIQEQDNPYHNMITIFKPGTDWLLHYHFEYRELKWILTFIHDYSL